MQEPGQITLLSGLPLSFKYIIPIQKQKIKLEPSAQIFFALPYKLPWIELFFDYKLNRLPALKQTKMEFTSW